MANALSAIDPLLGYRVTGPNGVDEPRIAEVVRDMAFELAERHDAFLDNPWPLLYRELDERYPGSAFILTVRPTEEEGWKTLCPFLDRAIPPGRFPHVNRAVDRETR